MAIKVPVYDRQVRPGVAAPAAPDAGFFRANQQLNQTIQGLGQLMQERALERQREKDLQQVLETETKLRQDLDNLLYNKEDGIITTRLLNNAEGAASDFKARADELVGKYFGSLAGEDQKVQFERIAADHLQSRLSAVAKHEAQQFRAAREQALEDSYQQSIAEILNNPSMDNLVRLGADYTAKLEVFLTQDGFDEKSRGLRKNQALGQLAAAAIAKTLEIGGDTAAARQIYDTFKDALATLPPEMALKLEDSVKDAELADFAAALYNDTLSKFKLADGMSDTTKMERYIYNNLTGHSREEKDFLWDYAKAKAGEDDAQRRQWIASNDRNFFNELSTFIDQKKPVKEALKLPNKYGRDPYDVAEKRKDVLRAYAEDEAAKNNSEIPEIYLELWRGVRFGEITNPEQINAAYDNGLITKTHFYELRKDLDEIKLKGISEHEKDVWKMIELLAPKNKKKKAQFMLAVKEAAKGKSPEETYEIAEKIKSKSFSTTIWDEQTGGWKNETYQKWPKQYKIQGLNLLSVAELNRTLGDDVVDALGGNVDDILVFADEFGGPYNLRIGTPQNNAIKSLMALGQKVTAENVISVLRQFPDGRVPPTAEIQYGDRPYESQTTREPQTSFLDQQRQKIKDIKPIGNQ